MKEKDMEQPNNLGHYHRDIVQVIKRPSYYVQLKLSCGHKTWMSTRSYNKYKEHATYCHECSTGRKVIGPYSWREEKEG